MNEQAKSKEQGAWHRHPMRDRSPWDGLDGDYRNRDDYADDPFKAMARHYDARVVAKNDGSTSIFAAHRRQTVTRP